MGVTDEHGNREYEARIQRTRECRARGHEAKDHTTREHGGKKQGVIVPRAVAD